MNEKNPLDMTREELGDILEKIRSDNSPVGIDASFTHAVIIGYLRQISDRLEKLEQAVGIQSKEVD